ncbi:hypothetical protein E1176_05385 [Fulvivirga sp. RKSG066]|uniref:hypothetical protein n=1 Tax=Fulvivirga aurantia TaxID=2529383 RepID=UPI0012BC8B78|nr:hypothetical protein [Fulvivirga aurantia]MTI20449.1 hypothetical protein [Fulvivirga aurantia]
MTYLQFLYLLVVIANLIILGILLWRTQKKKDNNNNDEDGGIEEFTEPTLDLPPGVTWPVDSPVVEKEPVSV